MFMDRESNLVLERMFSHDIKLPRYIPDDPWQKYNEMPFWRHRAGLLKNRKLIEKHGNTDHMYGRYMSHMKGTYGKDNIMPKHYYMPPGLVSNAFFTGFRRESQLRTEQCSSLGVVVTSLLY